MLIPASRLQKQGEQHDLSHYHMYTIAYSITYSIAYSITYSIAYSSSSSLYSTLQEHIYIVPNRALSSTQEDHSFNIHTSLLAPTSAPLAIVTVMSPVFPPILV